MSTPTLLRSIMSNNAKVVEGIFAINKPIGISSAGVLRTLQHRLSPSKLFEPWLRAEHARLLSERGKSGTRMRQRTDGKVKLGHGGTLDPMATGVLIVGAGAGTKSLSRFLECTKSYECVVLFGCATDSYDAVGKVVGRAGYAHVTREMVERALRGFEGKIMQKPPVFSALKVNGKAMYEYARAGGEIPEVKAREVEVLNLELVEWMEGGSHEYDWPTEEAPSEEKEVAKKLMPVKDVSEPEQGTKRKREAGDATAEVQKEPEPEAKKSRTTPEPVMSGALPVEEPESKPSESGNAPEPAAAPTEVQPAEQASETISSEKPKPPAARIRMTVTSGFYVRSLCHDLGLAVGSMGIMSSLNRTRQGDFELGKNVLEYEDLEKGEEVWGPQVEAMLDDWMAKNPAEPAQQKQRGSSGGRGRGGGKGNWNRGPRNDSGQRRRNSSSPEA